MTAVIDAPTADASQAAASALAERMRARKQPVRARRSPGGLRLLPRNALLFLSPERLQALATRLTDAEPLLSILGSDPNLRGLSRLLSLAQQGAANGMVPDEFAGMLSQFAETTEARADGQAGHPGLEEGPRFRAAATGGKRSIVLAKPVLDDTSIERATPALDGLRRGDRPVEAERPGLTIRVTGEPALRQQELHDTLSGALWASSLSFVLVALSLVLGIRSGRLIAALLITLVIGTVWTTGLAALAVGKLNLISVAFMVLFFGLGVDFGTHLCLRHLEEIGKGAPFGEALEPLGPRRGAGRRC